MNCNCNCNFDDCQRPCNDPCFNYMANLTDAEKQLIIMNLGLNNGLVQIENKADEEDLTEKNNVIKFADKLYEEFSWTGLGRVWLRKNIQTVMVGGVSKEINLLNQAMFPYENTIYIIQYDYDLNGGYIDMPANCVLLFLGGSLHNGHLLLNNTRIYPNFANFLEILDVTYSGTFAAGTTRFNEGNLEYFDGEKWLVVGVIKVSETTSHNITPTKYPVFIGTEDSDGVILDLPHIRETYSAFEMSRGIDSELTRVKGKPFVYVVIPTPINSENMRFYADGQRTDDIIPDSTTRQITTIEGVEYKVYIFRTPQCGEMDIQIRYTKETGFLTTEENGCGC